MIDLKLFSIINKQLQKTKKTNMHSTSIFNIVALMIIIKDYYQFTLH